MWQNDKEICKSALTMLRKNKNKIRVWCLWDKEIHLSMVNKIIKKESLALTIWANVRNFQYTNSNKVSTPLGYTHHP